MRSQTTPDGSLSDFHYDRAQRLRLSQNARQDAEGNTSYTLYDGQSRITEVGQLDGYTYLPTSDDLDDIAFPAAGGPGTKTQVTHTTYDRLPAPPSGVVLDDSNLSSRVTHTSNDHIDTYYDYDAHGNVKTLYHQIPDLIDSIIKIEYDYDLISGNVKEVRYEPGEADQYTHRYQYDADNRLTRVYTSDDGRVFDEEARYFYYQHGPLARVELGHDKVQGLDYFYSLQGWIKGMNGGSEHGIADAGADGFIAIGNRNSYIPVDTTNYALGYHDQDYVPIGGNGLTDGLGYAWTGMSGNILDNGTGLYNGNIAYMLTDNGLGQRGMAYQYDALHRIQYAKSYIHNDSWTPDAMYDTDYTYDANGNLQTLLRNSGSPMHNMSYAYDNMNRPNQLTSISQTAAAVDVPFPSQSTNNYGYDGIGNLIRDNSEGITDIDWTVYGKISHVYKADDVSYTYDAQQNRLSKDITGGSKSIYIRDASGNVMSIYKIDATQETQAEVPIYGSARIGLTKPDRILSVNGVASNLENPYLSNRKKKFFEISNHLGNVLTVVEDQILGSLDGSGDWVGYQASIARASDYYPFGLVMPNRSITSDGYRYGFNGKERDTDLTGNQNLLALDYGFRIYNPAIGKFLSVDPLTASYPMLTPYQFAHNSPVVAIDVDGLEAKGTNDEIDETFSGGDLPEISVVAKTSDGFRDQSVAADRYGTNLTFKDWQKKYGWTGVDYEQTRAAYNQIYGDANVQFIKEQDQIETDRILIEKFKFFTAPFVAIEDVAYVLPAGQGIGLSLRGSSLYSRAPFSKLSAKVAELSGRVSSQTPLLAPLANGFQSYAGGLQYSFTEAGSWYYRVSTLGSNVQGGFLTKAFPKTSAFAREGLALPPLNNASGIQRVYVPNGVILQRSRALGNAWGRGGLEQFEILNFSDRSRILWGARIPFK